MKTQIHSFIFALFHVWFIVDVVQVSTAVKLL
jgi:hypothetical protein